MSTPIFKSYGEFRDSDIFKKLFNIEDVDKDHFIENQNKAARAIVDQILRYCDGSQAFPQITTIVDFGCGGGSLIGAIKKYLHEVKKKRRKEAIGNEIKNITYKEVKERLKKELRKEKINFIGVDLCSGMINKAKKDHRGISFSCFGKGDILLESDALKDVDWPSTALLCLGHTWFHILEQDVFLEQIGKKRPPLLLVDVFQTWDEVLHNLYKRHKDYVANNEAYLEKYKIVAKEEQITLSEKTLNLLPVFVDEEARVLPKFVAENGSLHKSVTGELTVYSLRTQFINNGAEVVRGIYAQPGKGGPGRWLFATHQIAMYTESLRPTDSSLIKCTESATDKLHAISKEGKITGVIDYLVLREFEHVSGWGNMRCIAFGALSKTAHDLNEAYFKAVSGLVDYLFVSDAKLLPKDQKMAIDGLRKMIAIFGAGEVAVIMPFDPLHNFARMVPLTSAQAQCSVCKALSETDLILEHPNLHQKRFPTAYGLYHTMLALVSSPIVFNLSLVPGYEKTLVDAEYEKMEFPFFKASIRELKAVESTPNSNCDSENNDTKGSASYFIVPFYFGSLPLFALILEEPDLFPANATNGQVYISLAQNLDRQLHVVVGEDSIRSRVIAPLITTFWQNIHQEMDKSKGDKSKVAIDEIKKNNNIPDQINKAKNKGWKSWVIALPSHKLTSLDSTILQNNCLERIVEEESNRFGKDAISQLSAWLQIAEYFEGDDHYNLKCNNHRKKMGSLINKTIQDKSPLSSPYFAKLNGPDLNKNRYILIFTGQLLGELLKECETYHDAFAAGCLKYTDKNRTFQIVKRLFCMEEENRGNQFRFSFSRLYAVVVASSGCLLTRYYDESADKYKLTDDIDVSLWEAFKINWGELFDWEFIEPNPSRHLALGRHTVACMDGVDVIAEIATCIEFLNSTNKLEVSKPTVTYDAKNKSGNKSGTMVIVVKMETSLKTSQKGQDYLKFKTIINRHLSALSSNDINEKTEWKMTISAELVKDGFNVDWSLE